MWTETSPRHHHNNTETLPKKDRDKTETRPRPDRAITTPRHDRDITKTTPRHDRDITKTTPRHHQKRPRQDRDILGDFFSGACAAPGRLIYIRPQTYRYGRIIHCIENSSAASILVKGFSPIVRNPLLIGEYWLTAAKHAIEIYIERVESMGH